MRIGTRKAQRGTVRRTGSVAAALLFAFALALPAIAAQGPTRLLDASVSPRSGTTATIFTLAVTYRSQNDSPADFVRVKVGAKLYTLTRATAADWKKGVTLQLVRQAPGRDPYRQLPVAQQGQVRWPVGRRDRGRHRTRRRRLRSRPRSQRRSPRRSRRPQPTPKPTPVPVRSTPDPTPGATPAPAGVTPPPGINPLGGGPSSMPSAGASPSPDPSSPGHGLAERRPGHGCWWPARRCRRFDPATGRTVPAPTAPARAVPDPGTAAPADAGPAEAGVPCRMPSRPSGSSHRSFRPWPSHRLS